MTAVNLKTLLNKANKNQYALAGLVVLGWEDALAFTYAADETGIPIILQAGPSCRAHTPIPILGKMFRYLAEQTKTPICCHIDHSYTLNECKEGMDHGFTSVMYDGSKLPLKKNINTSVKIAKLAKSYNASLEGEVGIVGYHNGKISEGTNIVDAKKFADESGVDAMAISVGNTHLQTSKMARININKILVTFLLVHLTIWVLVPSITNENLPLDTIEALAWGSNLDWGFNKHPPLSAFIVEIFYQIFGSKDWAYYFLSQICLVTSFFVVWNFSGDFFKNKIHCLLSVFLLEGIYFYNYTTPEFNVYICELPFWALTVLFCWRSFKYNKNSDWLIFGLFSALGILSHYLFLYLILRFNRSSSLCVYFCNCNLFF